MKSKYLPNLFEKKWIKSWEENKIYKTKANLNKKKKYVLVMFPYPSGDGLHVGHARVYTGTDVLARYFRMKDMNVLYPMGWDAFGLPAENAAIKKKINPIDIVPKNIQTFKKQMEMLGFSYDWDRELTTTDPNYYRWTQWLFIQFFKMGLLYKKNTPINFCPICKTGLAEEEVLSDGRHERCGNKIEKREVPQWIFRITSYADRLLKDLEGLDWPKGILEMQRNWIGRKEGINIEYEVQGIDYKINCFTTRPDTNFGATFIVLAPEHEFVKDLISGKYKSKETDIEKIKKYVKEAELKSEQDRLSEGRKKTGVFTGFYALNKLNNKKLPIWISDFALIGFGTGAIVGVPGHDLRDFEFAKEFGLEVIRVVVGSDGDRSEIIDAKQVYADKGIVINSEFINGLDTDKASNKIMDYMERNKIGKRSVSYHLRDWIFSRQRYWGEPIPMVYCESCAKEQKKNKKLKYEPYNKNFKIDDEVLDSNQGWFPIDEKDLPLELPYVKSYEPTGTGESPLSKINTFINTTCPNCGGKAKRETDTMPNWAGSCWYFLAFAMQDLLKLDTEKRELTMEEYWKLKMDKDGKNILPVDWYIGGAEHAVLHLLYSRFWIKVMKDLGLVDFLEPFLSLRNVGMLLAEDHRKMSKSLGNVINPDDVVKEYGADALRIYEMFMAPFNAEIPWSVQTLQGSYRFLVRIWQIYNSNAYLTNDKKEEDNNLVIELQKTIISIEKDITDVKFNTCISTLMKFINEWESLNDKSSHILKNRKLTKENAKKFLQTLSPFAPFITEEIWSSIFKEKKSIHLSIWPIADTSLIHEEDKKIAIQVNGKLRGLVQVSSKDVKEKELIIKNALLVEKVSKYIGNKKYKAIYIEGRILNFIIE